MCMDHFREVTKMVFNEQHLINSGRPRGHHQTSPHGIPNG